MAATSWVRSHQRASNPQHICIITETYPPEVNGVAFTLAHLVEGLSARGHDVSIVRPRQGACDHPDRWYSPHVTLLSFA
jgi:hypothetical protein